MARPNKSAQQSNGKDKRVRASSPSEHEDDGTSPPSEKRKKVRWGGGLDAVGDSLEDDGTEEDVSSVPEKVRIVLMHLATWKHCVPTLQICLAATSQL